MQGPCAARAGCAVDIDGGLDPQQVGRESAAVGASFADPTFLLGWFTLRVGKDRGLDLLGLLQPEQELILGQALSASPEAVALHRQDDLAQPLILGALLGEHRLERLGIVG